MRATLIALFVLALGIETARAADLRYFDDAALYAVQFVDRNEGWAVGDEGVVWHTINGGRDWERQATGIRASLRSVHFVNPYTGWIAGREELPRGGSAGVLLFTADGGIKWTRVSGNSLPALNQVRFLDNQVGYVAGDCTDLHPTGLFKTEDTGRTWKAIPLSPGAKWLGRSWRAADFKAGSGLVVGERGSSAVLRDGELAPSDLDDRSLGGRAILGGQLLGQGAVAVGQGGLVLLSNDAGQRWGFADLKQTGEVRASWDFLTVSGVGTHLWVAGRPGSAVLHSGDKGQTWNIQRTGQPLPLHHLCFLDEKLGWAVGELGTILATTDGGQTWEVRQRGGQRAALLFVHARPESVPLDTLALFGGDDGYLTTALQALCQDPTLPGTTPSPEGPRLAAAARRVGGASGEALWQFPLPGHLTAAGKRELIAAWDKRQGDRAEDHLLRQLVLALRVWRPNVVVTDHPDAQTSGDPAGALLAEAVAQAVLQAPDPKAYPEHLETLGLETWQPDKLYCRWDTRSGSHVLLDLTTPRPRLETSAKDFVQDSAGMLAERPALLPAQRHYRLLSSRLEGAAGHQDMMQGIRLAEGGTARRKLPPLAEPDPEIAKAQRARRNLEAIAELPPGGLADPNLVVSRLQPLLATLPDDQAARATFTLANQFVRTGHWQLAHETFHTLVLQYPAHPLAIEGYRWLLRYQSSSEARRRNEFKLVHRARQDDFAATPTPARPRDGGPETLNAKETDAKKGSIKVPDPNVEVRFANETTHLTTESKVRAWYQDALKWENKIAAFGPLYAADPGDQFCFHSARRQLGDFEAGRAWCTKFLADHPAGPWSQAAKAELWLINRSGPPPKPLSMCRLADSRPTLDGRFDDPCWQGVRPIALQTAAGELGKEYHTDAWLAHDRQFLYIALRCRHPADRHVAPVKVRGRDADLRGFDRVDLLFDLDRDYATYFRLQIDQRGCLREDCWGDQTWNPRWFVAVHSEPTAWQVEAAIPLAELSAESVSLGRTWAFNATRVLPGRGMQTWSSPADVEPRPEGMGLMVFMKDAQNPLQAEKSKATPKAKFAPNAN